MSETQATAQTSIAPHETAPPAEPAATPGSTAASVAPSPAPFAVTSRTVVFAAVGAALYGALGTLSFIIPGTLISIRPAIAIIPFVGLRFGPIAGLFTGFVGNALVDQLLGYGFLTYWNWSLANGLVGLLAGLAGWLWKRSSSTGVATARAGIIGAVVVAVGLLFTFTDLALGTTLPVAWSNYGLAVAASGLASLILVPVLDRLYEPIATRTGR